MEGRDDTDQRRNQDRRAGERSDRLSREILVLAGGVILGTIMTVLDLTVVNAAIRTLGTGLNASIPAVQWVLTGYMLAFATVIPLTGWAAALIGATLVPGLLLPRPRRQAATQERI